MPRSPIADTEFLKKARERFKLANDADTDQAQRERDDIAFEAGDQWPADIKQARMGQQPTNGMPAVPARPTLVINKVKEPVRQILNQERQSDIGIELVPADDFGDLGVTPDDTEVTLREGLVRRIQRESQAADARTWAFKRAVIAGRGFYLVMTRFLPGKTWDQEIYVHRIYNQAGVLLDPAHEQPDGSDAEWGFIGTWLPWDRALAEFPVLVDGDPLPFSSYSDADFMAMTEAYPDWYRQAAPGTGDRGLAQAAVRVVDYWHTERVSRQLAIMDDGSAWWAEDVPEGRTPADTRTVIEKQIKFCKILGGVLEVERTEWAGPDMPIVKVLGDEVLPYDEQRRAEGVVRPSRDAAMGGNYMISKFVETVGLTPLTPLIVDPEAIDGYEFIYGQLNTRTVPYAPSRTYDDQGRPLKEPHRPAIDPNVLPMAQGIALFDGFVQQTTGGSAPDRLGVGQRVQADRAIARLQQEEQFNTSNFLDNLARSIRYEGQVINNLLYPIYGAKPGRLVRVLTGEGEHQQMQIAHPEQQQVQARQQQQAAKVATLTKDAHFNVIVKVTKAFESRRAQETASLAELMAGNPVLMTWFGDLFFKNSDGPGHMAMADRAKVMLAPPIQQMLAQQESGQAPIPPQAQQQIAMLTQRLQELEQIAQQMHEDLKGKRLESQTKVQIVQLQQHLEAQKAKLEADRDLELQRMKDATTIRVAEINAEAKGVMNTDKLLHESDALHRTHAHEAALEIASQEHQATMAAQGLAAQAALGEGQQEHEASMADLGQQHALEQGQQAADLAPSPQGDGDGR